MANAIPIEGHHTTSATHSRRLAFNKYARRQIVPRIILIVITAYYLLPFYWMLSSAFKPVDELSRYPPTWFPPH